jgi:NAD+ kinase
MIFKKLSFLYSGSPKSVEAYEMLTNKHTNYSLEECDVIVSLGGDGFFLQVVRPIIYRHMVQ